MEPQVAEVFWNQLAQSGLLSPTQLAEAERVCAKVGASTELQTARCLVKRGLLTSYQADRLLEGRSRGFFYDQYKIIDILGVGGMGWVYQAEDTATGQVVALKVLQDQLKHDQGLHARFVQEARVGLKLHHPNIVRTDLLGSAGGLPYMVMEFVHGPSLLELMQRRGALPWPQACEFARQAALGLDYAHHIGLVHRDVKPQNLLVDETGRVKLLDFGLSMLREGETGDEFSMAMIFGHESVGTVEFSSPEQAADSLSVDARSDIYSLGGTLFMALTTRVPFEAKSAGEMLRMHKTEPPRSVRELVPDIPEGVAAIVTRMLAKRPEDRYATAADVAQALAVFAQPGPVSFDFQKILAIRKKQAQQKLAQLSKSRTSALASSTTRPGRVSSVASANTVPMPSSSKSGVRSGSSPALADASPMGSSPATVPAGERKDAGPRRTGQPIESTARLTSLDTNRSYLLQQDQIVVGRRDDADLPLREPTVSSRHCELRFDGFHWWVTDLGSRNGTLVNGAPVSQQQLRIGDVIQIGSLLRFRLDDPSREPPPTKSSAASQRLVLAVTTAVVVIAVATLAAWWIYGRGL
jgi:serine/threonine-protein kinase